MAALLACAPAVASHVTAARLWGLLRSQAGAIHLIAPSQRHPRPGFVVHCARLAEADITVEDGIPVTALARTHLDLAGMDSVARVERALERSEELGLFDLPTLEDVLGRYSRHPGAGKLRRALDIYRPDPVFTRSKLERRFLGLAREAGLPVPAVNFVVAGFELDAYWERERFVVELDVFETHGTHAAFERDRLRQEDLKLIGIEMIRVTGPRLKREPRRVMERLVTHLERRRRELRLN
jgi:hypothetical protein